MLIMLIFFSIISFFVGVHSLSFQDLFDLTEVQRTVLVTTRIPRTISLIIAGASMSVCGLIMQHLTQNKFVSPTTAGTMDSAQLGILFAMLFMSSQPQFVRLVVAFLFSLVGTMIFMQLLQLLTIKSQVMVPLIGVMFGNIIGAIATFFAYQYDLVQNMSSWLQGNFSLVTKGSYELIFISVPLLFIAYYLAYQFTLAGMGESLASGLGQNYKVVQRIGLVLVAAISSVTLITVGNLPFLGVIIPNIVSIFWGDHMKNTLSLTAMFGAVFLVVCDIISRLVITPYEVPVSLIVGIIGCFLFIILLLRGSKT